METEMICVRCGEENEMPVVSREIPTLLGKVKRYHCKGCGLGWYEEKVYTQEFRDSYAQAISQNHG